MFKGTSLTINSLVLILLAMIVLGSSAALFIGTAKPSEKTVDCHKEYKKLCIEYMLKGCCEDSSKVECRSLSLPVICTITYNLKNCCFEGAGSSGGAGLVGSVPEADARVGTSPNPTDKVLTVSVGETVYFDGSTYSSDSDGNIVDYKWDFDGDGSFDFSSATGTTTHTYTTTGKYTVTLLVTDNDGNTDTDTVTIYVVEEIAWCMCMHPENFWGVGSDDGYVPGDWSVDVNTNRYLNTAIEKMKDLGVKYVRIDINWKHLEPGNNAWNQHAINAYRNIFEKLKSEGFEIIAVIGVRARSPAWADNLKGSDINSFWKELKEYSKRVATEYGDLIDYYQLSNEEDTAHHEWFSTDEEPTAYMYMRDGIEEGDGNYFTIINPFVWSGGYINYLRDLGNNGALDYIDIIGPDPYPEVWFSPSIYETVDDMVDKFIDNSTSPAYGKRLSIMETGCCGNLPGTEQDQSKWIRKYIPELKSSVKHHKLNDFIACYYMLYTGDTNFGLIDINTLQPKPSFQTLKDCIQNDSC